MKKILLIPVLVFFCNQSKGQLFKQSFDAPETEKYVNIEASREQFTGLSSTGKGINISTKNGKLQFNKITGSGYAYFSRTVDFSPLPGAVSIEFDLGVLNNKSGSVEKNAAIMQIGGGFVNGINTLTGTPMEPLAAIHSRLGINFDSKTGSFSLRNIGAAIDSESFNGTQKITWVINNMQTNIIYSAPDGAQETLQPDRCDVWVGETKVFNKMSAVKSTQELKHIKFSFLAGKALIEMDNLVINQL